MTGNRFPWRAAVWRPLLAHPGAHLVAILGIALGVALGLAIALINTQAVQDVSGGLRRLAGEADLILQQPSGHLNQDWYSRLVRAPGVEAAAPQLRVAARMITGKAAGTWLSIWGVAPLSVAAVGQALLPPSSNPFSAYNPRHLFLDQSALQRWHLQVGQTLLLEVAGVQRTFVIAGSIPDPEAGVPLATMDIAAVQWLWGEEGEISNVALRLAPGMSPAQFQAQWVAKLPPGAVMETPQAQGSTAARASRAYRANLLVLSLVALFTGAFLVYTTLAFSVTRQRRSLAILRILGLRRHEVLTAILLQGLALGLPGALLGIPLGIEVARVALAHLGGNLGAGYFSSAGAALQAHPLLWLGFGLAGVGAALFGAAWPAWESRNLPPIQVLGQGSEEDLRPGHTGLGAALLLLAALAIASGPINGIPYGAYGGIALLLFAVLFLLGPLTAGLGRILPRQGTALWHLASETLRGTPGRASRGLAAMVVAFSLVVAMAVMVGSFRDSVAQWLQDILQADLYVQAGSGLNQRFSAQVAQGLCSLPGVRQCSPLRREALQLLPDRPPVMLLARGMNLRDPGREMQILQSSPWQPGAPPPIWISEILAALAHWHAGQLVHIPLGGQERLVRIAGVYRDYAYQQGAITLPIDQYRQWTHDQAVNGVALWTQPNVSTTALLARIAQRFPASRYWQMASPGQIRQQSLKIFDQSFAATYALEAVALIIGLLGVANGFAAQTLQRRQEFALLRTLGLRRREVARLLLTEGLLLSGVAVVIGAGLGLLISLVLILRVNPQSFHWHMGVHLPWAQLGTLAAILFLTSTGTILWTAWRGMGRHSERVQDV